MTDVITSPEADQPSLFLAGGITGCPDWQSDLIKLLGDTPARIFNPRRPDFPMGDKNAGRQQVEWEFRHLRRADFIAFWFCKETVQPIALFELGAWSMVQSSRLFVGADPSYERRFDVITQLALVRPEIETIEEKLEDLALHIKNRLRRWKPA